MADETIDIRRIANLARLHLDDSETEKYEKEIGNIVNMVKKLPNFSSAVLELNENDAMVLREDIVKPSANREDILKNAPQTEAGCVVVPKIVE